MKTPYSIPNDILKRRTFAIISHPDAGKTTLTEQILLETGAINLAGQVRAKSSSKRTISRLWPPSLGGYSGGYIGRGGLSCEKNWRR